MSAALALTTFALAEDLLSSGEPPRTLHRMHPLLRLHALPMVYRLARAPLYGPTLAEKAPPQLPPPVPTHNRLRPSHCAATPWMSMNRLLQLLLLVVRSRQRGRLACGQTASPSRQDPLRRSQGSLHQDTPRHLPSLRLQQSQTLAKRKTSRSRHAATGTGRHGGKRAIDRGDRELAARSLRTRLAAVVGTEASASGSELTGTAETSGRRDPNAKAGLSGTTRRGAAARKSGKESERRRK